MRWSFSWRAGFENLFIFGVRAEEINRLREVRSRAAAPWLRVQTSRPVSLPPALGMVQIFDNSLVFASLPPCLLSSATALLGGN